MKERHVAIVLAAGKGRRMNSKVQKQYLLVHEKPVLFYSLSVFEKCPFIDEVILVTGHGEERYCRKEIVESYGFRKVKKIVPGGKERYHSVYEGIKAAGGCDYLYIHDGARPFITQEILERGKKAVEQYGSCVVGMPVKDTIKLIDEDRFAVQTPEREKVWLVQTPQIFRYDLIKEAYEKLMNSDQTGITDDAMVVERMMGEKVKLVEGSYQNIKITTPEDLGIAELFSQ
ncbi:MAG: 2-C-methyl-D-erythritol 4-phosphate cytidylyltransferase [Lachnospiraceae bacterium]|nr:2-C-methyl-D-erythritol 4-phosphate cytidylyltransferase [Robinsoniella sp.]MDY3767867.1 2-C-methyl-D-erythritol 4-phosphate cytidylyltransferase [Lachnospiraceae bacterium]